MAAAVLGVIGVVVWAPVGGFALELAHLAQQDMAREDGPRGGGNLILLGRATGVLSLLMLVIAGAGWLLERV